MRVRSKYGRLLPPAHCRDGRITYATQEQFTYYHSWKPGDVLMWDEQATLHRNAGDYRPEERRIMLRTIVFSN